MLQTMITVYHENYYIKLFACAIYYLNSDFSRFPNYVIACSIKQLDYQFY